MRRAACPCRVPAYPRRGHCPPASARACRRAMRPGEGLGWGGGARPAAPARIPGCGIRQAACCAPAYPRRVQRSLFPRVSESRDAVGRLLRAGVRPRTRGVVSGHRSPASGNSTGAPCACRGRSRAYGGSQCGAPSPHQLAPRPGGLRRPVRIGPGAVGGREGPRGVMGGGYIDR